MPTVWIRSIDRPKFHRTEDCRQLLKPPARGTPHPIRAVELSELSGARPCKTCYADAPRSKVVRRACGICNPNKVTPCEHNGGVLVTWSKTIKHVSLLHDPGDVVEGTFWVWPDRAWLYEPVAS